MPSDDGLRLEDFHRVQHLGSLVIEPSKYQAIDIADGYPLGRPTPQHIELMANFGLQGCARPEQPGHGVSDQPSTLRDLCRPCAINSWSVSSAVNPPRRNEAKLNSSRSPSAESLP
jgi:hypothetical protein